MDQASLPPDLAEHLRPHGQDGGSDGGRRSPVISPIAPSSSLSVQAYERIKAAIVSGDIQPDTLYSVNQFAELLGVSRTPVREALLGLVREGILQIVRNRGFRLLPMTRADLDEIIALRAMLEVPAMVQLAQMRPPPDHVFRQSRETYRALQDAADAGDILELLSLDRQFHLQLIGALGNGRLTRLVGELRDHMHLPGLRRLAQEGRLRDAGREHLTLLEALEAGDPVAAADVMTMHLSRTKSEWS